MENETTTIDFFNGYSSNKEDWFIDDFGKRSVKKRKPREKSLEYIHDLWRRSEERDSKRRKILSKCIDEIVKEVPKDDRGYHKVYFDYDGTCYNYSFRYESTFKSYGYSLNNVKFSDDIVRKREEKIDFVLSNLRQFELGEKFRALKKLECKYQYLVKEKFLKIIKDNLEKIFKDKDCDNIIIVSVGDKKYYFELDEQHRYYYKKFNFKGEVTDNEIKM